jgi:cytochrome c biogenesis protein ResB
MKKIISIILVIIVGGLLAGGAFYGGMIYGKNKTTQGISQERQQRFQQMGASASGAMGGRSGNQAGNNFATGQIISKDDKSITIKLQDGGSKIIFFSDTTGVSKFTTGSSSDLEVGKTVMITGKTNQDGSITAQSIQLRPEGTNLP